MLQHAFEGKYTPLCALLCAVTNIFVFQVTMFAFSLMVRPELARAIP